MKIRHKIMTLIVSLSLLVLIIPKSTVSADIIPDIPSSFLDNYNYIIQNSANATCLQEDTDGIFMVEADSLSGSYYQQWSLTPMDYGYYAIVNAQSGGLLTAPSSNADGEPVNVQSYSTSLHDLQSWKFTSMYDGTYLIQSKAKEGTSLYLALNDGYSASGNNVAVEQKSQSSADRWKLWQAAAIIDTVPRNLSSSLDAGHLCIPCAVTNVAAHWSVSGYSGFGCSTAAQQEVQAQAVTAVMKQYTGGDTANDNIPAAFAYFSHTSGGITYGLSAQNQWRRTQQFTAIDIMEEIDLGTPLLLGYMGKEVYPESPYGGAHMTVCAGYEWVGTSFYVYVSDAHKSYFVQNLFTPYTDNDFISRVNITLK